MKILIDWAKTWSSPPKFCEKARVPSLVLITIGVIVIISSWSVGLFLSPPDYQQSDAVRIIYVHVPSALMSMFIYCVMAVCSFIFLVWRIKLADVWAEESAKIGMLFTAIALITGSLWGKPMWGTWWIWDARLTSELILLFLYIGYLTLRVSIPNISRAAKVASVLNLVTLINVPIIHYSVNWWYTLHQGGSIKMVYNSTIAAPILIPLLLSTVGCQLFYLGFVMASSRLNMILRESRSSWALNARI